MTATSGASASFINQFFLHNKIRIIQIVKVKPNNIIQYQVFLLFFFKSYIFFFQVIITISFFITYSERVFAPAQELRTLHIITNNLFCFCYFIYTFFSLVVFLFVYRENFDEDVHTLIICDDEPMKTRHRPGTRAHLYSNNARQWWKMFVY